MGTSCELFCDVKKLITPIQKVWRRLTQNLLKRLSQLAKSNGNGLQAGGEILRWH